MAKGSAGQAKSVPNKHLHARIAYLHQAATHLALHRPPITHTDPSDADLKLQQHGLPLLLAAQLKAVCSTPLMPGTTSETRMENLSRAGKKPCADVLVIHCRNCHTKKRFPMGAQRQKKKAERKAAAAAAAAAGMATHDNEVEMKNV
ncbi:hypothetical protein E4T42_07391 [Aureobasidium subglaciale]|nr:hypothetical protein E4T38_02170 [Aureobasidium subglaciale]KAI5228546.1 hypothetical protein E4T40_01949 [Aureobasidium subglaciale]KAI5231922.1 hypothetical protein E4T41_02169 [Aureobasidium subglaciale]KAI5243307.1 hypothetical protein E4T42_07391 [Aureobasidium subglaciale]KAI5265854.1 hypothetical protein E4T46_01947 [Aureobasidium subglaciale]